MAASTLASPSTATSSRKLCTLSISIISVPKSTNFRLHQWNPQLGICKFVTWNGLKHQGVPHSHYIVKIERRGRCRRKGVYASLFGVGAPEALVIGVVALMVFGPKGLAEVARNMGKTIRAFQPTIRELQEVSMEFKNTLEREIGLDEIEDTTKNTSSIASSVDAKKEIQPNGSPSSSNASLTEEREITAKEQLEASSAQQQKEMTSAESPVETEVTGSSPSAVKEDSVQEYLKKLEEEWKTLNSEKQKKAASAATEIKSQVSDSQEAVSVTPLPQKTENDDQIEIAGEQQESSTSQHQEETASAESLVEPEDNFPSATKEDSIQEPVEPHGQSEAADGSSSPTKEDSIQEYLKKLEEEWKALNSEKQKKMASAATEMKTQDTQEAGSVAFLSQKPENENQM